MNFAAVYLIQRFFYRIWMFFYDWYIASFLFIGRHCIDLLERLDRYWALRITFKNLFQPLYQDHTAVGRILGFVFRILRIICALGIYLFIILLAIVIYAAWAGLPIYIVSRGLLLSTQTINFSL
jgi:hypothetical protein